MSDTQAFRAALQDWITTPLDDTLVRHLAQSSSEAALTLFQRARREVPAYRDFLAQRGMESDSIAAATDYARLPLVTKQNYMRAYPLPQRCWQGQVEGCEMIAVSSGSTGEPMFWPRTATHELDIATRFEQIFRDSFAAHERRTLAVVCFTMGTWVGGMYTAQCCRYLAQKGYPITLVTPGNNKTEIFRAIEELGPLYDQVVLLGYPPFVKDVIDSGLAHGIDWARHRIKMVFAGEVFSEEWRTLVCERASAEDPVHSTASLYGTADAGVLGNETPLSINIRRWFARHPDAVRNLFGESRLPSLLQYDPMSCYFETHEGTLVVSRDNGVPLIRYHIADKGGIVAYQDMLDFVHARGGALSRSMPAHNLPFVYLFGRADFTVSYYGANIYPENITVGLEQPGIQDWVTGKFVLEVREDADGNKQLGVTVELLAGVEADAAKAAAISASIKKELLRLNSEYAHYVPAEHQSPRVRLCLADDPEYFPIGVKHRYTRGN